MKPLDEQTALITGASAVLPRDEKALARFASKLARMASDSAARPLYVSVN